MKTLSIDIESFSDRDLNSCGVYKYASSPFFCILLFAYSVDGGEVQVVDLMAGQEIPEDVLAALTDSNITKYAYNAIFERVCLSEYLRHNKRQYFKGYGDDATRKYISPRGWKCTMTWAAYMGLPLSLRNVGLALKLDEKKMEEGKDLIRYFCMPCKPTNTNGGRTRNLPAHAPDKWKVFKAYNKRDVEVEMSVQQKLRNFPVPEFVWEEYWLDQEINDRGIMLDINLVNNAITFDERVRRELVDRLQQITEVENPNSVQQMKEWLRDNGLEILTVNECGAYSLICGIRNSRSGKLLHWLVNEVIPELRKPIEPIAPAVDVSEITAAPATEKQDFSHITRALTLHYGEPKPYHFSNEYNMLNKLVLGMTAKEYRKTHNIPSGKSIRPYLTSDEIKRLEMLEIVDMGLLVANLSFSERKEKLTVFMNKYAS